MGVGVDSDSSIGWGRTARVSMQGNLGRSAVWETRLEWYLRRGRMNGSGVRPPFAPGAWDPGYESKDKERW